MQLPRLCSCERVWSCQSDSQPSYDLDRVGETMMQQVAKMFSLKLAGVPTWTGICAKAAASNRWLTDGATNKPGLDWIRRPSRLGEEMIGR